MTNSDLLARPPIGFIVEGLTEYQLYPSIVTRCVAGPTGMHLPLLNARGNNRIRSELEALLEEMVKAYAPHTILVTLDAREVLRERAFERCVDLREHLQSRCDEWLESERIRGRLRSLPTRIVVVVQHPTLEAWLIADLEGLSCCSSVIDCANLPESWIDVDSQITNPCEWLSSRVRRGVKLKPTGSVVIARSLSVVRVEAYSRSFRKFAKEVRLAYARWAADAGLSDEAL